MNTTVYEMLAAPELAPAITPTAAGGFAGAALTVVFAMLYCFGTSEKRRRKLPERNAKAKAKGRKQVRARAPIGPFNPENWDDVDGDGVKDAPKWLTGVTIAGAGAEIGVRGRALDPALVPGYLTRLRNERVLQGTPVGSMQIGQAGSVKVRGADGKEAESPAPYVEFSQQSAGSTGGAASGTGASAAPVVGAAAGVRP